MTELSDLQIQEFNNTVGENQYNNHVPLEQLRILS